MNFNPHFNLEGQHAFLGASKYHWINYDDQKIIDSYASYLAVQKGTELHALARGLIENRIKLPRVHKTLNMYVNDAIGYRLIPEQILYYSDNCFGTADTISSLDSVIKQKTLRIHDYKSGKVPAHMEQLKIYAALFCLEYNFKPADLSIDLRLYQNDEIVVDNPDAAETMSIMNTIIKFDKIITRLKLEEG